MNNQTCTQCVLSTADDAEIFFNEKGICNHCVQESMRIQKSTEQLESELKQLVTKIKAAGKNSEYDCLIGVSGGVDSSYLAYKAVELGLRPLILHYDNGWNSEMAVMNIENIVKKLNLDLYTHVNNWEEFKDIQVAFIKASVIDIELITDQAIVAIQFLIAKKFNIKYILAGNNTSTESILPKSWYHWKIDVLNIRAIHKKFGKIPLKTYPTLDYFKRLYINHFKRIQIINLLDFMPYNKAEAKKIIIEKIGWRDYGGKHFESIFTRFYQAYILPVKFHVDKRKAHLASLICSGQMTREEAFEELKKPIYDADKLKEDKEYVVKKLGMTEQEFDAYMQEPVKSHLDYPSYLTRHYKIEATIFWLVRPITRMAKKLKPKTH